MFPILAAWLALSAALSPQPPPGCLPGDCEPRRFWLPAPTSRWWLAWDWRDESIEVVPRAEPPAPPTLLATGREYLGTPYVRGGIGEGSFDCSGFTNKVYARHGYDLPRVSREQYKVGLRVGADALQVGDLLFYASKPGAARISHVAMYAGDGQMIHAVTGKGEVTYDRLASRWYAQRFVGARRILALPPGDYSTRSGVARPGMVFDSPAAITKNVGHVPMAPLREDDEIGRLIAELEEHPDADSSPLLSQRFVTGALTHVGPRLLTEEATMVGLRLGAGRMGDRESLFLVPEVGYFDHGESWRLNLAAPFQIPIGEETRPQDAVRAQWSRLHDYTKIVREVSYGQKESALYVEVGRTASGTLGHGQIMRYYTPNLASRSLPHYVVEPDALSLAFDGSLERGSVELFIDDLWRPQVAGLRVVARPAVLAGHGSEVVRSGSVGLTYAVDARAPYRATPEGKRSRADVHGAGVDLGLTAYRTAALDWSLYLDGSILQHGGGSGWGGALGTLLRTNLAGKRLHVLRLRLEGRISNPSFIPSYFDTTYRLGRRQAPVDDPGDVPLTKLALLEELEGTARRFGFYGELTYHYARRFSVGLAYEDGGTLGSVPPSERYTGRSLMLVARAKNLYLPGTQKALNFHVAYHLRNFASLGPLLGRERTNEYLFAMVSLPLWRYLAVGGGVRKALDPDRKSARNAVDALVDLSLGIEL